MSEKGKLPLEQRTYMTSIIKREAEKRSIIRRNGTVTKTKLLELVEELKFKGKERLMIDRNKGLVSQTDETLIVIFSKLNYIPVGKYEECIELALKVSKSTEKNRRMNIIGLDTLIEHGRIKSLDLNELKAWNFGITGNNTLINQNFVPFEEKKKNA